MWGRSELSIRPRQWLNTRGVKEPHEEQMDRQINEVLLTISQLKMRERAAGGLLDPMIGENQKGPSGLRADYPRETAAIPRLGVADSASRVFRDL